MLLGSVIDGDVQEWGTGDVRDLVDVVVCKWGHWLDHVGESPKEQRAPPKMRFTSEGRLQGSCLLLLLCEMDLFLGFDVHVLLWSRAVGLTRSKAYVLVRTGSILFNIVYMYTHSVVWAGLGHTLLLRLWPVAKTTWIPQAYFRGKQGEYCLSPSLVRIMV